MKITSLANPKIKELALLKKNKVKKERGLMIVDGLDFIELAYRKKCLETLLYYKEISGYEDIEKIEVTPEIVQKLSPNQSTSSVIGVCRYPHFDTASKKRIVYLDGVQDPGNVGTIIRTALAFSYNQVILSKECASIYNDKVISASKGAIFLIDVVEDISLEDLKDQGYQIIGSALENGVDYQLIEPKEKFVLVLGNEGQGIQQSTFKYLDSCAYIPMNHIDSLNVAVAAGILMNEFRRKTK